MKDIVLGISNETAKHKIRFGNVSINEKDFYDIIDNKKVITLKDINIKWLFLNIVHLDKYLYQKDKIIVIKFSDINISFSNLFYLYLLIDYNKALINFSFSYEDIVKINQLQNILKDDISKVLLAKIIIRFLDNCKGTLGQDFEDKKNLQIQNENIIKNNIESFKKLDLNWKMDDILGKSIDLIYIEIIIGLIKKDKFTDYEYVKDLLNELEIDSIDIDENIKNRLLSDELLSDYLITNKDKYVNEKKINFYYFFFKYILKNRMYIYQLNFLLNMRNLFIKKIKNKSFDIESKEKDKGIKERFSYIIQKILNTEFYYNKYNKYLFLKNPNLNKNNKSTTNDKNTSEKKEKKEKSQKILKCENDSIDENKKYEIISYEKTLCNGDFILEVNNNILISGGNNNPVNIIYKDQNKIIEEKKLNNINYITKINDGKNENIILCSGEEMYCIKFNDEGYYTINKINNDGKIFCTFISKSRKDYYLISGPKGFYKASIVIDKNASYISSKTNELSNIQKPYKKGIEINDYIIALTSNSIYCNGENELIFYNLIKEKTDIYIKGYSFTQITNGLEAIPKENPKILVCACNHTSEEDKNGILLINLNLLKLNSEIKEEDKNKYLYFLKTKNFYVNCICHISSEEKQVSFKNSDNIQYTDYILAGGLDNNKGNGSIQLYRINYYKKYLNIDIKQLQEIPIKSRFIPDFRSVDNITKLKNGKIVISSSGKLYLFKAPNLDYYYEEKDYGSECNSYFNSSFKRNKSNM